MPITIRMLHYNIYCTQMLIIFMHGLSCNCSPLKDMKLNTAISLREILDTPYYGPVGYTVEVSIEFPIELLGKFKRIPSMPRDNST